MCSWFGGVVLFMNIDVYYVFVIDGYVNGCWSSYLYGDVVSVIYMLLNGFKLGVGFFVFGYIGIVFEFIDEFKGDFVRVYFYMVICYENVIVNWEMNSIYGDVVLNGMSD